MTSGPTRAGRVLRVVQQLRQGAGDDALALGERRRAQVAWPAGALARCVVLRAQEIAPARALRAVKDSDVAARRLWQRSFDDVLGWPEERLTAWLAEPRTVAQRCGGSVHRLVLEAERLCAADHPHVDLDAEAASLALGGTAADCVRSVLLWRGGGVGPAEAVRSAGLLSLLRWSGVLTAWCAAGVGPSESHVAVDAGLSPHDLSGHRAAGLALPAAVAWHARSAPEALRWRALWATPEQAEAWVEQGRTLDDAEAAAAAVGGFATAFDWAVRAGRRTSLAELSAWAASGRPASHWGEVASRRLAYEDVQPWIAAGLGPAAVLRWSHLGTGPQEALAWQAAGIEGSRAVQLHALGLRPQDAAALRDVRLADLLQWWPVAGSVDAVRALLAEQDVPA